MDRWQQVSGLYHATLAYPGTIENRQMPAGRYTRKCRRSSVKIRDNFSRSASRTNPAARSIGKYKWPLRGGGKADGGVASEAVVGNGTNPDAWGEGPKPQTLTMVIDHGTLTDMETVSISKFKATCLARLEKVKQTGQPLLVTRRGAPIAEIQPPSPPTLRRGWLGTLRSTGRITGDIISPAGSVREWEAFK